MRYIEESLFYERVFESEKSPMPMIDIQQHREQFVGLKDKYYFNYGGQGILSRSTLDKIVETYQHLETIGPFGLESNDWINKNTYLTKKAIAGQIGAKPRTIALSENVTSSCNIALWGIQWQEGEEILLTDAEHPGIIATVKEISRRFGVKIATCPIIETVNGGNPTEVIANHLTKNTRLLVISHILWNTGQVLPLEEIVGVCHANSTEVLVDGAQSAGSLPLNLIDSEVDYYGCTGHKWFCGSSGVGFLYVKESLLQALHPTYIGWRGLDWDQNDIAMIGDARRFEVATSAYPLYTGLQEAIAIHEQWSSASDRYDRICHLSKYLWEKLNQLEGIECLQHQPPRSGLVSFYPPAGKDPQDIVTKLEQEKFYLRTLSNPYCIRACVHYFTLESEIDALIEAIDRNVIRVC